MTYDELARDISERMTKEQKNEQVRLIHSSTPGKGAVDQTSLTVALNESNTPYLCTEDYLVQASTPAQIKGGKTGTLGGLKAFHTTQQQQKAHSSTIR